MNHAAQQRQYHCNHYNLTVVTKPLSRTRKHDLKLWRYCTHLVSTYFKKPLDHHITLHHNPLKMSLPPSYSSLYQFPSHADPPPSYRWSRSDPPPPYQPVAYAHERTLPSRDGRGNGIPSMAAQRPSVQYEPYYQYRATPVQVYTWEDYYTQATQMMYPQNSRASRYNQGYDYQPQIQHQAYYHSQAQAHPQTRALTRTAYRPSHYHSSGASTPYTNPSLSYSYVGYVYTPTLYSSSGHPYIMGVMQPWY